ncbi:hypothetical protein SCUCBS95973_004361 [Sporothrix curviconia]|uniref:Pentatricopeptide repeat protein n=1 Tax=Sporothrix curviconia TaxID=1260050 RepID=A0ABP0BNK9_9PEZI
MVKPEKKDRKGKGKEEAAAEQKQLEWLAKQRLRFLKDAYTIGEAVAAMLQKDGKYEEALQLTRMASKNHKVVVAWNYLIDYQLHQQKLSGAMSLFNEMKKRAQFPNAQTYTIIFRGCAASRFPSQAVYHATRIYYAMLTSERIKPTTIHMNAVLTVCSRAGDLDSMFSIVSTADEHGRLPDNLTYTIVLTGLRLATAKPGQQPDYKSTDGEDQVHVDKESPEVSIRRARALWEEVIKRWRQGNLIVDEELVCAMGRLLRLGSYQDIGDILSLVQQTMGIQRPDMPAEPLIGAPKAAFTTVNATGVEEAERVAEKETEEKIEAGPDAAEKTVATAAAEPPIAPVETKPTAPVLPSSHVSQFDAVPGIASLGVRSNSSRTMYAKPGANTLSLVLIALATLRNMSLVSYYWKTFTGPPYNIVPDADNWHQLTRVLRRSHASTEVVEYLTAMPGEYMSSLTFQTALATCMADSLNEHAFANAGKLLDLMKKRLIEPDIQTMLLYIQTAQARNRYYRRKLKEAAGNPMACQTATLDFGRELVRALERLWDPMRLASNAVGFAEHWQTPAMVPAGLGTTTSGEVYTKRGELAKLARKMAGVADMVITETMADEATIKELRVSRSLLNRQIARFYGKREGGSPNP